MSTLSSDAVRGLIPPEFVGRPTIPIWPDAGQFLGLGRGATYAAAARGEIPVLRFANRIVCPTAKLLELVGITPESTEAGSPSQEPTANIHAVPAAKQETGGAHRDDPSAA